MKCRKVKSFFSKYGAMLLAAGASAGVILSMAETGRATAKAVDILQKNDICLEASPEAAKACWKIYVPAALLGAGTIACVVGSCVMNQRRIAGLTSAYLALGKSYQEYRKKIANEIGVNEECELREEVAKEKELPVPLNEDGERLYRFYEPLSKRYFESSMVQVYEAAYLLNRDLANNGFVSLSDWCNYLGLDFRPDLEEAGWCIDQMLCGWDACWLDVECTEQEEGEGSVYCVTPFEPPIRNYMDYDGYKQEMIPF